MSNKIKCVFFDRDGIANESPGAGYVLRPADFKIIPEFIKALAVVAARGYQAAIVTNQSAVAKGMLSRETLDTMHAALAVEIQRQGVPPLLDVIYCPHNPGECDCRKPQDGMLLTLAMRHNINLKASWMVGDNETDVTAGSRAGCRTVRVHPDALIADGTTANFAVATMAELPNLLRKILTLQPKSDFSNLQSDA